MIPTETELREFWEWCGLEPVLYKDPPYDVVYWKKDNEAVWLLDIDLNNLFKHAVSKLLICDKYPHLTELALDPAMCDTQMWYCYLRYDSLHDDGFIEREEIQSSSEDPAIALFWAIHKVIREAK